MLVLVMGLALQACAQSRVPPVPPESPFYGGSLPSHDAALRHYVTLRDSSALGPLLESGPKDALIRQLSAGLFLHRLGRFAASNVALQEAERLAEERYTKSITQNIAAFIVSDNVLDYYPSALEWSMIHYYGMMNYSSKAFESKKRIVAEFIDLADPENVLDIGANDGYFSRLASSRGVPTLACDIDPLVVEANYQKCLKDAEKFLLPLILDITNPSPDIGWENRERTAFLKRIHADTVVALASVPDGIIPVRWMQSGPRIL